MFCDSSCENSAFHWHSAIFSCFDNLYGCSNIPSEKTMCQVFWKYKIHATHSTENPHIDAHFTMCLSPHPHFQYTTYNGTVAIAIVH